MPYWNETLTEAPSGFTEPLTVADDELTPLDAPVTGVSGR